MKNSSVSQLFCHAFLLDTDMKGELDNLVIVYTSYACCIGAVPALNRPLQASPFSGDPVGGEVRRCVAMA